MKKTLSAILAMYMIGCSMPVKDTSMPKKVADIQVKVAPKNKDLTQSELESALTFLMQKGQEQSSENGLTYDIALQHPKHGELRVSYTVLKLGNEIRPYLAVQQIDKKKMVPKVYTVWDGMSMRVEGSNVVGERKSLDGKPDFFMTPGETEFTIYMNARYPSVPKRYQQIFKDALKGIAKLQKNESFPLSYFSQDIRIFKTED